MCKLTSRVLNGKESFSSDNFCHMISYRQMSIYLHLTILPVEKKIIFPGKSCDQLGVALSLARRFPKQLSKERVKCMPCVFINIYNVCLLSFGISISILSDGH